MNNPISACLKNTPALKSYWSINLKSLKFPVIAVFVVLASLLHVKANRFYVDGSKPDNSGAGTSWATAKRDIQNAVNTALPGDSVWVKAGTYYPTEWPGSSNTAEPRNKTFYLKSGVKLFGGFAGTETFFAQRNVINNSTVLSGNIGSPSLQSDNCFHVVVISNQTATTTGSQIDGFSIRDGYADNSNTSYILNGKLVENVYGAGIYCINGTNNIIGNNIITNNRANIYGAAIYITADTTLSDFYMYGNNIGNNFAGWNGGGVYASKAFCNLYNNNFYNDTAAISGGGIYYAVGKCTIEYNTVDGNKANQNGGGIMIVESFAKMANNTIRNNSTNFNGGGIYLFNTNGGSVCINNLLDKNAALQEGGGIYLSPAASCAFAGNTITGNTSNANGGGFLMPLQEQLQLRTIFFGTISGEVMPQHPGQIFQHPVK